MAVTAETRMTVPVMRPTAAELTPSASRTGSTIAGTRAMAALSKDASTKNTTRV